MLNQQWIFILFGMMTIHFSSFQFQLIDDPFDLISARIALCPIVGFHGMFCPGVDNTTVPNMITSRQYSGVLPLPVSVGMAIDLSTGNLLLPALKFSSGNETWTDQESKQTFLIPPEILLKESSLTENSVNIRIFRTEIELANVWLKNAQAGGWTGGQLAHVQNISDIYKNYFKDNQATAITQDLTPKYTVTIKDDHQSLKLNKYAQRAIDALTVKYNEELYQNFLDVWGTHITISTTVGGMTEQQILFKSCLLSSTDITDGITQTVFEENLKQDLLETTPCLDKFYYARRKKFLDHRVGGNILLINNTDQWKQTIISNPALLIVEKYLPWYDLISNSIIQINLKKAIEQRMNTTNHIRRIQTQQIEQQRRTMTFPAKVILQSSGYTWTIGNDITLKDANQCSTGLTNTELSIRCNTGMKMSACALQLTAENENRIVIGTREVPISYERNNQTGSFRIVARRQYGQRDDTVRTGFTSNYLIQFLSC